MTLEKAKGDKMAKLIYKAFDGKETLVEVEYPTLNKAMFEALYIQKSITGDVIKVVDGDKVYKYKEIQKYWKGEI